ncbi:flagellar hook-length control protein FliK [Faunimonas sp. B44]|uniref:flagellar hook-length control protein FliK n=1 Tax=Faunimonas sp. B44 TaxID=3461493 RepID=UPI004044174D
MPVLHPGAGVSAQRAEVARPARATIESPVALNRRQGLMARPAAGAEPGETPGASDPTESPGTAGPQSPPARGALLSALNIPQAREGRRDGGNLGGMHLAQRPPGAASALLDAPVPEATAVRGAPRAPVSQALGGSGPGDEAKPAGVLVTRVEMHFTPAQAFDAIRQIGDRIAAGAAPTPPPVRTEPAVPGRTTSGPVMRSLEIRLDPEQLGEVGVRLRLRGSVIDIVLDVARDDLARELRAHQGGLAERLGRAGLELDALTVRSGDPAAPRADPFPPAARPGDDLPGGAGRQHANPERHDGAPPRRSRVEDDSAPSTTQSDAQNAPVDRRAGSHLYL